MPKRKQTKRAKPYAPSKEMLGKVMRWMARRQLYVYGPGVDLDTGERFSSQRDFYSAAVVMRYVWLLENKKIWERP